jgi:EAL domain-containing protein (putative c-di-GMP-specific phosphodiesterase class I)
MGIDRASLEASFERAIAAMWVAYQPIVHAGGSVFGYEALMRSTEPSLPHPGALIDAAERLDRLDLMGRTVRALAAEPYLGNRDHGVLFVNLHVNDLMDATLTSPKSPLSQIADRVVLEVTERASLDEVRDARVRIAALREMGFRIAVDDMGAGYAGLSSFALLEPEIVKLDMSLVRDVHTSLTKRKVIRSMTSLSKDMGMMVVAEGVETTAERDTLVELGCDLFQGFLIARPGRPFPEVSW